MYIKNDEKNAPVICVALGTLSSGSAYVKAKVRNAIIKARPRCQLMTFAFYTHM